MHACVVLGLLSPEKHEKVKPVVEATAVFAGLNKQQTSCLHCFRKQKGSSEPRKSKLPSK